MKMLITSNVDNSNWNFWADFILLWRPNEIGKWMKFVFPATDNSVSDRVKRTSTSHFPCAIFIVIFRKLPFPVQKLIKWSIDEMKMKIRFWKKFICQCGVAVIIPNENASFVLDFVSTTRQNTSVTVRTRRLFIRWARFTWCGPLFFYFGRCI